VRPTTLFYILGTLFSYFVVTKIVVVLLYKNINSFHFKPLFFGLINIYFMVYYFKGVVKHYIKKMEIQITI